MSKIKKYAKAITAGVVAVGGTVSTALADDHITNGEWAAIIAAVIVALGATAWIPNKTPGA
jgi:hypothetical protein